MGKQLRVLIVEDSEDDAELLLRELKYCGYMVESVRVETAAAMQSALREKPWDLILSDYGLPQFNALGALQVMQAQHLDLPFIIVSGSVGEETAVTALRAGAHDFLLKNNLAKLGPVIERELLEAEIRRERQQTLQTGEDLFGMAFQHSPVGVCITSLDGRFQTVSQSLLDMLGFTRGELDGKHFSEITHPDDVEIGRDVMARMMSGEVPSVSFEKRYLRKTGEPIWTLVSSTLLRDSSGEPVHFITHIFNLNERKQAEEQIQSQATRLKVLADTSQTFATTVHDYQAMLEIVARQTSEIMQGSCGVRLLSEDGQWLEMVAIHDVDPEALDYARRLSDQPLPANEPNVVQRVLQSERALLLPGHTEEQLRASLPPEDWDHIKFIASHSRVLAPIRARGQALGILIIARKLSSPIFDEQDLSLAQDLADRAALAISNARLFHQEQSELAERTQVEESLRESQARLSGVIDSAMDAIITIDEGQRITLFNPAAESIFGYRASEIIGASLERLLPEQFRTVHHEHVHRFGQTATTRRSMGKLGILYGLRADGEEFPIEASISQLEVGGQKFFTVILRDISERVAAQAAVFESEARYQRVLDAMMEGCQIIDFGWRYVYVNDVVAAQGKYKPEDLLNRTMMEVYPGIENTELFSILHQCMEERTPRRMENQFLFPDGSLGWFELSIQPAREGIFVLSTDITERKRQEEALRLSEENFAKAFRSSPTALMITRLSDGKYIELNEAYCQIVGYERDELIGHPTTEFNIYRYPEQRQEIVSQLRANGSLYNYEAMIQNKAGEPRTVLASLEMIHFNRENCVLTTMMDITDRKRAEESLRESNEELQLMSQQLWQAAKLATMGELAASIAHELNNPLATVSLRTEMLSTQFSAEAPQSRSLQIIDAEVKRMSGLVANLLQFSRHSASQISTIKVNEEITSTLELIQYHLRKNAIHTVEELSAHDPLVQADRQQLRQVFLNLFTNASDAMPLGGILTIRTWTGEKPESGTTTPLHRSTPPSLGLPVSDIPQVFIEVSDTGDGISAETLERVWEPFYTTKPEGKGTGLGLAICRRIVQEHGGTIEIISSGIPGKGTVVRLSLPATKGM